jgi:hypothetical protein
LFFFASLRLTSIIFEANFLVIFMSVPLDGPPTPKDDEINQKLLEVQKPFLEKVSGRRRHIDFIGAVKNACCGPPLATRSTPSF